MPSGVELDFVIKQMLWEGKPAAHIAKVLGLQVNSVYNVKAGRRGYYVEWPDGSVGSMADERAGAISRRDKGRGRSKELQQKYELQLGLEVGNSGGGSSAVIAPSSNVAHQELLERMEIAIDPCRILLSGKFKGSYPEEFQLLLNERNELKDLLDKGEKVGEKYVKGLTVKIEAAAKELLS